MERKGAGQNLEEDREETGRRRKIWAVRILSLFISLLFADGPLSF